ncbi:MAG TPA: hypothetical protein VGE76_10125 [Opitutaceae bacterium]
MAPTLGASTSRYGAQGGERMAKLTPLPLAVLEAESLPDDLDVDGDTGDLIAASPRIAFAAAPLPLRHESARLADRRALTLVGIVVLVI